MIKLEANFPQYFDIDGSPLDNGSIYFGVAGMNPETSPIVVFKDQDGTLPVAQPLKTVGGSIVYGGANIHVFADVLDYSYTVKNKRGEVVSTTLHFVQEIGIAASIAYAAESEAAAAESTASAAAAAASAISSQASADAAASVFSGETLIDNGEIINVIRRVGTIPPSSFTAGQFVIDRWKAGASGMTRANGTFDISGGLRIITGTIIQTVYAPPYDGFLAGDQVTIAWEGESQVRVNGGTYSSSPYIHTFVAPVSSFTVEFNNAGDGSDSGEVSKVRAYRGNLDKGITSTSITDLEIFLSRYYQTINFDRGCVMGAGQINRISVAFPRMVAIPTVTVGTPTGNVNVSGFAAAAYDKSSLNTEITATASAYTYYANKLILDTGI